MRALRRHERTRRGAASGRRRAEGGALNAFQTNPGRKGESGRADGHHRRCLLYTSNIYNSFINNIAYLERIFETMDEPVEVDDVPGAEELPPITGEVD